MENRKQSVQHRKELGISMIWWGWREIANQQQRAGLESIKSTHPGGITQMHFNELKILFWYVWLLQEKISNSGKKFAIELSGAELVSNDRYSEN